MKPILIIILSVGLIWLRSGYEKLIGGTFANSLGILLTKTAEKNPYPFFRDFLISVAIPNSQTFGLLVVWGELLAGVAMVLGAIILLLKPKVNRLANWMLIGGVTAGLFLNVNYWLGLGHTSPATETLNLLMIVLEVVALVVLRKEIRT